MSLSATKRALIEMSQFGALSRRAGGWFSCNNVKFFECTVLTLISRQLAIYSINEKLPGKKFVRLNEDGIKLGRATAAEVGIRKAAREAITLTRAEISDLIKVIA